MAGFPFPRLKIDRRVRVAVRDSGVPGHRLACILGFHHSKMSALVNARSVPATPSNIECLQQIADVIGYPRDRIFVHPPSTPVTSTPQTVITGDE